MLSSPLDTLQSYTRNWTMLARLVVKIQALAVNGQLNRVAILVYFETNHYKQLLISQRMTDWPAATITKSLLIKIR
jgi:hypothetical protein